MTNDEKVEQLRTLLAEDAEVATDELLNVLIEDAESIVLERRYPYGYEEGTPVPSQYERLQIRIALELYNRMGAEGQTSHNENGMQRSYNGGFVSTHLLKQIVPIIGSVTTEV